MKYIFLVGLCVCSIMLQAQHSAKIIYDRAQKITTNRYVIEEDQISIDMSFGQATMINEATLQSIMNSNVRRVDLVFSNFPEGKSFENLNINRLNNLRQRIPSLFETDSIKWTLVRQTDCTTKSQAEELFHGLVFSTKKKLGFQHTG